MLQDIKDFVDNLGDLDFVRLSSKTERFKVRRCRIAIKNGENQP